MSEKQAMPDVTLCSKDDLWVLAGKALSELRRRDKITRQLEAIEDAMNVEGECLPPGGDDS